MGDRFGRPTFVAKSAPVRLTVDLCRPAGVRERDRYARKVLLVSFTPPAAISAARVSMVQPRASAPSISARNCATTWNADIFLPSAAASLGGSDVRRSRSTSTRDCPSPTRPACHNPSCQLACSFCMIEIYYTSHRASTSHAPSDTQTAKQLVSSPYKATVETLWTGCPLFDISPSAACRTTGRKSFGAPLLTSCSSWLPPREPCAVRTQRQPALGRPLQPPPRCLAT